MVVLTGGLYGAHLRMDAHAQLGERGLRTAIRTGELRTLWPCVVVEGSKATQVLTRAAAALLAFGREAAIFGTTAAYLHGCTAVAGLPIHIVVPSGRHVRPRQGLVVHHADRYRSDVVDVAGLRLLSLDRTVCDLLCTARQRDALAVADQALALQHDDHREAFRSLVQRRLATRPDPRGTRVGAVLLDLATGRAESPPESWVRLLVVELGFPVPESNWWVCALDGVPLYRLDLAWTELRIALEYDGYAAHVDRSLEDAEREADLRRRGWIVIRATAKDLRDPVRLERELRAAFSARGC